MAESHFISALKQRRGDYLGELQAVQASMSELEAKEAEMVGMLEHVDALLRKEAPDLELETIRPRKRGSLTHAAAVPVTRAGGRPSARPS